MLLPTIATALVAQGCLTMAATIDARQGNARAFVSTRDLNLKLSEVDAPISGTGDTGGRNTWDIGINDTPSGYKQTVKGFGGTVTDATVFAINQLPDDQRSNLLRELMTGDGERAAHFAYMRHTIGASDLSADPAYTYDDNGGVDDPDINGFGLGDRGEAMARLLAEMKQLNPDTIFHGSPWSAPAWMKPNRALQFQFDGNELSEQWYGAYAKYIVRYIQAYAEFGVDINAISIQNEPLNVRGDAHMTMGVTAEQASVITRDHVGPALRDAGLGNVEIWAFDHNTNDNFYPETVLRDAGEFVAATAWHCYAPQLDWTVISRHHDSFPDKANHMTECFTSLSLPTQWNQASKYTIGPLQNWVEASGMWTLGTLTDRGDGTFGPALSGPGPCAICSGLFLVNESEGSYELTGDYYMLAQISKFMPVGAKVLSGTGSWEEVQAVGSVNPDGTRTVVVENGRNEDFWMTVTTDSGEKWSGLLRGEAVTTWVLP